LPVSDGSAASPLPATLRAFAFVRQTAGCASRAHRGPTNRKTRSTTESFPIASGRATLPDEDEVATSQNQARHPAQSRFLHQAHNAPANTSAKDRSTRENSD